VNAAAQRDVGDGFNIEDEAVHGVAVLCEVAAVMSRAPGWHRINTATATIRTRFIGQSDMAFADAQSLTDSLAAFGEDYLGFAPRVLYYSDVADPNAMGEAGPHGFDDRFLRGEAHKPENGRAAVS